MKRFALRITQLSVGVFCLAASAVSQAERDREYAAAACTQVLQDASTKGLKGLPDFELEHSLCMTAKILGEAIKAEDPTVERLCSDSVKSLIREFKRRWPNRQAGEVFTTC